MFENVNQDYLRATNDANASRAKIQELESEIGTLKGKVQELKTEPWRGYEQENWS